MSNISDTTQKNALSKQVLQVLNEVQAKLEAVNKAKTEPIAIVGIGCRFPGGANDPSTYWHLLSNGIDAVTVLPPDRGDIAQYYDPDPQTGKTYTREGGFIHQVDRFDPQFFGISPREAVSLDPQHRLLLEVTWEALENGGQSWTKLRNSKTGVFMSICTEDYGKLSINENNPQNVDAYAVIGANLSLGIGRISHLLGLQGPNIQLDTSCSSSLVAAHLACQSLRLGECNLALAGGVNLILSPLSMIGRCQLKGAAADGRCKTFDASANGYGFGEGCGVVALKRLSDAIADNDRIFALIRGSAINHDGPSSGLTVPNGMAQIDVIKQALKNSQLESHQIDYVEAHGTGTTLGDPIEIEALAASYGQNRPSDRPLVVGSVKTNLGHLEAAAGVASLIKTALILQHQKIPPHLHFKQPNPHLAWDELSIKIPTTLIPWDSEGKPRIAGISSFGMSGTNAHLILEEAPSKIKSEARPDRSFHILTLSAQTKKALKELATRYQHYLKVYPESKLADICYTANIGRAHFNHRLAVIASDELELAEKLNNFTSGQEEVRLYQGQLSSSYTAPKIAFLFTGQGSQYINMGRQLYETQPVFRQALDKCDEILRSYLQVPLLKVLYPEIAKDKDSSLLHQTNYTQPALFAIEYALAELWKSWGIEPNIVLGHSVGEYVAATVAGVLSLEEGLKLIATRGSLMQQLPSTGEMVSVMASKEKVDEIISPYAFDVAIAAVNGPESVVISGASEAIRELCRTFEFEGIKIKRLQVSHAFHSKLMEPMLADFEAVAKQVTYNQPRIPLVSNVTGELANQSIATAKYWVEHIRKTVKFYQSMENLLSQGYEVFLEIGPSPILLGMVGQYIPNDIGLCLPSIRPGVEEWSQILSSLGQLYVQGINLDWCEFERNYSRMKLMLPTYPFQKQRYWIEDLNNEHQPQEFFVGEKKITPIIESLYEGETHKLAEKLKKIGNLSPSEVDLLPKILNLLVKEHQQELTVASIKDFIYEVQWKNQARFGRLAPRDYLRTPVEITQHKVGNSIIESVPKTDWEYYKEVSTHLEKLSGEYIVQAFVELGWNYQPGETFSTKSVAEELGVVSNHQQLLNRLLQILEELGIIRFTQQQWQVLHTLNRADPEKQRHLLLNQYPQTSSELNILHRCASQLSKVLLGELDPVQLVFPQGDLTDTTQIYTESPVSKLMNTIVQKTITAAIDKLPRDRGIRLLEIGAGTGGTTSYILPELPPEQTEYLFTDIGGLFITKAQDKFKDYPFVRYQTLDIEVDPTTQGLEKQKYDIVLAANVLHATTSIKETLTNVRSLLADGGMLVLLEGTTRQRVPDLIFGLLEGWWKFKDVEWRGDYPLVSSSTWKQLLAETGFTQIVTVPEAEVVPAALSHQTLIVAKAEEIPKEEPITGKREWLILVDNRETAQQLTIQLGVLGEVCRFIFPGAEYQQLTPEEYTINPHKPEEFEQLLAKLTPDITGSIEILNLWSLNTLDIEYLTLENLEENSQLGCVALLSLVQALLKVKFSQKLRLWLVTKGSQPVLGINSFLPGLAQSPLWGMGKVISLEHPELWGGMIDLEPNISNDKLVATLISEIRDSDDEDHVAFRNGKRYIARLIPNIDIDTKFQDFKFKSDGTYLITGGLGFLGLKLAHWMAQQGAKHLVLIGRKGIVPREEWDRFYWNSEVGKNIEFIQSLENSGVKVTVFSADVTDLDKMSLIIKQINTVEQPLRGIIHAAGVSKLSAIEDVEFENIKSIFPPKIVGSWILHQLTKKVDLDFFICFSSGASVWGSKNQSVYAAANHFLDTIAYYRRSIGMPGLSINWGSLGVGGMASEAVYVQWMKEIGLDELQPEQGFNILGELLKTNLVQTVVANVNWSKFKAVYQAKKYRKLLAEIETKPEEVRDELLKQKHDILLQLEVASEKERYHKLIAYIQDEVALILGIKDSHLVDTEQGFFDMGIDSLMTVELRNKLQLGLNCSLPETLAFEFPNIISLAKYIADTVLNWKLEKTDNYKLSVAEQQKANLLSEVEQLSEDDVEASIAQELLDLSVLLNEQ